MLESLSFRIQDELGREVEELANLFLQHLVIDFSVHNQLQWPSVVVQTAPV